jgi:acyl-coenzyme A synthetase/AMP-(fatty) acid ligase
MPGAVDFLLDRMRAAGDRPALIGGWGSVGYDRLLARIEAVSVSLPKAGIAPGAAVLLCGDFNPETTAWLLALWENGNIVIPVAPSSAERAADFAAIADVAWIVTAAEDRARPGPGRSAHPLYDALRREGAPGLVIFTSGTSGAPKGALHDVRRLLKKFEAPGKDFVTLAFLLFDHIAGVDTLLYCLSNASTIVCPADRAPPAICDLIERHRVEVLPTAPSFLNLLLLSGAAEGRDLSSLKIITYGAEMMPQALLERVAGTFPAVRLIQKYGTSEIGALRSRSDGDTSRWIRIGAENRDWRVADGHLEIRAETAMLGYLNAPSPFTEDGWYKTGDRVEVQDGALRFLGRDSDIINVGGQKVFPAEVEEAIRRIEGIADAAVFGVPHPILGATVCARIRPADPATPLPALRVALRQGLAGVLESYKIPQKIEVTTDALATDRFKQKRDQSQGTLDT